MFVFLLTLNWFYFYFEKGDILYNLSTITERSKPHVCRPKLTIIIIFCSGIGIIFVDNVFKIQQNNPSFNLFFFFFRFRINYARVQRASYRYMELLLYQIPVIPAPILPSSILRCFRKTEGLKNDQRV